MQQGQHLLRLPLIFVRDREDRGLSCGHTEYRHNYALCDVSTKDLIDMADDAQYQGWETDMEHRSVPNSARRAAKKITDHLRNEGLELPASCRNL
jgi:hypothetical protein